MGEKPAGLSIPAKKATVFHGITRWLNIFTAMRTGMVLIIWLVMLSAAGTVLRLDLYHSLVFQVASGLLCLNLAACSLRRFPALVRQTFGRPGPPQERPELWPVCRTVPVAAETEEAVRIAYTLLKRRGFALTPQPNGLHAVKGRLAPWGILAVHLSLLLVITGAVYGHYYGFSRDITLPVGGVYRLETGVRGATASASLKLNNFTTEYYQDGTVSDWISDLSLERDGREELRQDVKVNWPLEYDGVVVYQMSCGTQVTVEVLDAEGTLLHAADLKEKEMLQIGRTGELSVQPVRATLRGRVAYIVYEQGRPAGWGSARLGEAIRLGGESGSIRFTAATPYAGLQVKSDPGLPWVWFGFSLMTLGFFVSLYTRRSELWLTVVPAGTGSLLRLGGRDRNCAPLLDSLQDELSPHGVSETGKKGE